MRVQKCLAPSTHRQLRGEPPSFLIACFFRLGTLLKIVLLQPPRCLPTFAIEGYVALFIAKDTDTRAEPSLPAFEFGVARLPSVPAILPPLGEAGIESEFCL